MKERTARPRSAIADADPVRLLWRWGHVSGLHAVSDERLKMIYSNSSDDRRDNCDTRLLQCDRR